MAKMKYPGGLGTIQITLPAAVAGNIDQLQNSLKNIGCHYSYKTSKYCVNSYKSRTYHHSPKWIDVKSIVEYFP